MIVKPTVNELLQNVENRYALVIATSRRAREIAKGDKPLIDTDEQSPVTIAANEIVEKKVYVKGQQEDIENTENTENIDNTENVEQNETEQGE